MYKTKLVFALFVILYVIFIQLNSGSHISSRGFGQTKFQEEPSKPCFERGIIFPESYVFFTMIWKLGFYHYRSGRRCHANREGSSEPFTQCSSRWIGCLSARGASFSQPWHWLTDPGNRCPGHSAGIDFFGTLWSAWRRIGWWIKVVNSIKLCLFWMFFQKSCL